METFPSSNTSGNDENWFGEPYQHTIVRLSHKNLEKQGNYAQSRIEKLAFCFV